MSSRVGNTVIDGNRRTGRLWCIKPTVYEGERLTRDGHLERRRFTDVSAKEARFMWREWCGFRAAEERRDAELARRARAEKNETKEKKTMEKKVPSDGKIYALSVVGGPSLYVFEDFGKACAVCDALTAAAKASGFAAKYDVTEVKRWAE